MIHKTEAEFLATHNGPWIAGYNPKTKKFCVGNFYPQLDGRENFDMVHASGIFMTKVSVGGNGGNVFFIEYQKGNTFLTKQEAKSCCEDLINDAIYKAEEKIEALRGNVEDLWYS